MTYLVRMVFRVYRLRRVKGLEWFPDVESNKDRTRSHTHTSAWCTYSLEPVETHFLNPKPKTLNPKVWPVDCRRVFGLPMG